MALSGIPVIFHLSPQGEQTLAGWIGKRSSFPALMVNTDAVGAWILLTETPVPRVSHAEPVLLVKWEYVVTATFELSEEAPPARAQIGFRARPV